MDNQVFTFFIKEISKVAGVELNLRGYSKDPTLTDEMRLQRRKYEDDYDKAVTALMGPKPDEANFTKKEKAKGLRGLLGGKIDTLDTEAFREAMRKYRTSGYDSARDILKQRGMEEPIDDYDYAESLRSDQKHKDRTYGKLTSMMFDNSRELRGLDTDEAYSENPYSNYLDDQKLDKIVEMYKGKMGKYDDPASREGHQRFLDRAAALRKDPDVKGYRLEWG